MLRRMLGACRAGLMVGLMVGVAGCGLPLPRSTGSPTATVVSPVPTAVPTSAPDEPVTSPEAATSAPAGSAPASSVPSRSVPAGSVSRTITPPAGDFYRFQSGTRNIACAMTSTEVRCDIAAHTWTAPPQPAECEWDWGNGLNVRTGGAAFTCASDTVLGEGTVLPYGTSVRHGQFVCTLLTSHVECRNRAGHGFVLSRQIAKTY
ncbi:MAG: DUF6636 domain-containing protein [Kineosporiaceae bacterium]